MLKTLIKLLGPAILVYGINFLAIVAGVYGVWPWFDIPMHFLGGVAIAWLAYAAWGMGLGFYEQRVMDSIPLLIKAIAIIGFVSFIGIAWEWHEFLLDAIHASERISFIPMQPGLGDTMKDLLMDILGGVVFMSATKFFSRR